jgi:hypothetical protein
MGSRRSEEEGRRTVGRPSPAHRPRSGNLRRGQIWGDLCWIRQSAGRPSTGRDRELRLRLRCLQRRRRRRPLSHSRSRRRPAVGPAAAAAETPPQSPLSRACCSVFLLQDFSRIISTMEAHGLVHPQMYTKVWNCRHKYFSST